MVTQLFPSEQYMNYGDRGRQKVNFDYYIPAGTPVLDKNTGDAGLSVRSTHRQISLSKQYRKNRRRLLQQQQCSSALSQNILCESEKYHIRLHFPESMAKQNCVKTSAPPHVNVINPFCFTDYEGFDPEWASANLTNGGPASVTYQIGANIKF